MPNRLYDITRPLARGIPVWPGDTPFDLRVTGRRSEGNAVNITTMTISAHTATHVDAPYHFDDEGVTMEAVDLAAYWGPAQVVTVRKAAGPLTPDDFAGYDLGRAPRLLVHSPASEADPTVFHPDFAFPSEALADYLGARGIVLYGADGPSMDASDSKTLPGHAAMKRNNILILEGVSLAGVPDGLYELAAFPLKILGGDGSPVRAVLRSPA
jgi:arylformamidase